METGVVTDPSKASESSLKSASSSASPGAALQIVVARRKRKRPINWQPTYRHHKPTGRAVVTIDCHDHYLGQHGTKESKQAYNRIIAEWRENGCKLPATRALDQITVNEIVVAFWRHVKQHYVDPEGNATSERGVYKTLLKLLRRHYGSMAAVKFTPKKLKALRLVMVDKGWKRTSINRKLRRIKSVFDWAVGEEMYPVQAAEALRRVRGLGRGQYGVKEGKKVKPVPAEHVAKTMLHLSRQVRAIVELEAITGARGGEILIMRPIDIEMNGEVIDPDRPNVKLWHYCPYRHKNQHRDQERFIPLGERAQQIIAPFLEGRPIHSYLFSPKEAEAERRARQRKERKTPLYPSHARRYDQERKKKPARTAGDRYTPNTYHGAIERACVKAGVPHWSPHQLRHARITEVSQLFGREHAQALAGHRSINTTAIYDASAQEKAKAVARKIG